MSHMDYSSPLTIIESGARAFNLGIPKSECPISSRTNANGVIWWNDGWDKEDARTCRGRECNAKSGVGHSEECINDHEAIYGRINEIFPGTNEALGELSILEEEIRAAKIVNSALNINQDVE